MKIVVIHGQNHKGSTWNVANILLQDISCEKEVREFFLPRDLNHFCTGCYSCLEGRDKCPFWEDKKQIDDAMNEAELLILTTPNYCMMPSAPMKAFLDLFFTNWFSHKPQGSMFKKRAVVVSTTAGAGAGKASKLVANNLSNWGIPKVFRYGLSVNATNWNMVPAKKKEKIKKDMKRLASKLSREKSVRVGIKTRILFWFYGGMQKANWGASSSEREYWESRGWLNGVKPWNFLH
ncbi:MAG: NAD(P)H-dependent oxidoreductase [Eubacterium sp.]|nr:NAD(P)H-dependent oxidoreductase [Eubacterium sp.]